MSEQLVQPETIHVKYDRFYLRVMRLFLFFFYIYLTLK